MSDDSRPAEPRQERTGERLARWADSRLGHRHTARSVRRTVFPSHASFMLGEIALYSFVVVLITGVYLSLHFHPSSAPVVYDGGYRPLRGQLVSEAYASTLHISFDVRAGLLIRQAHHWAALVLVAAVFVHMLRVFFTGAFRKPRELNWVFGFLLLVLAMFGGLTGYDLPDDLLSGTGLQVVNGTLLSIPVVGTYVSFLLFGGEFPGEDLIARFNTLHVLVIPGLMVALLVGHLLLAVRHRHTQYPGPGRTGGNVVGLPFKVYAVKSAGSFFLVSGVIFFMAAVAQINPVWNYGPFRPDQVSAGSQPDWYMGVADGLLRVMPGWEIDFWGHTLALDTFLPLLAGVLLFLAMGAYPFLEAWVTDDDREQHLLDRPRNRPVRTALGVAWLSVYAVALIGAANDLIATRLHVSLDAVTWTVRIALFAVPVLAFVVTKRLALGLQRRDRDKVVHGRETGVIKRLPDGGYVELHEPLDQARLHTLTAHEQYRPLVLPGRTRRLRVGLSRVLYGPGTQIPKPTPVSQIQRAPGQKG
ncbi:cytochrome b [Streptomyces acidiscabies]|uniref:Cytochrome bc1 complex cytochrome b subunit n=1 Tax=Streptomyces acidiscabies TaxID=42234 RepID=A0AAP6BEU7_9ACTN|nr:cytochrome bc complex cytochrome b subunit [Streptomyces acidiscabies]MBP5942106.1 ubiquinol-cytochrome c reductase cytochrome b subunit [Streptomyces sp. LBUM 1476]MBZ3913610.1 cytochrome bc complex cytochrome b subunit [Streptomyces acidiscabies]MDX2963446.1 cytochrome bc complex cytochrome b subunit [Streptomyces acidiscabies]MDX3023180.1 cytochrome bc complex cytochrome b subunit [Streptomyces acidiscabies]MDX3792674.1 cytochrome bc complex cytochrome b subunit [Streptomyces acidiscabie